MCDTVYEGLATFIWILVKWFVHHKKSGVITVPVGMSNGFSLWHKAARYTDTLWNLGTMEQYFVKHEYWYGGIKQLCCWMEYQWIRSLQLSQTKFFHVLLLQCWCEWQESCIAGVSCILYQSKAFAVCKVSSADLPPTLMSNLHSESN